MRVRFELASYRPIEDGWYFAELTSVRPETTQYGKSFEFKFRILDEKHHGRTICKFMQPTRGLIRWIAILTKTQEDPNLLEYELNDLIGCTCQVYIETFKGKNRIADIEPDDDGSGEDYGL